MKGDALWVGAILTFLVLLFSIHPIMAVTSSHGAFNVTPDLVYVNWTNGNITVASNSNNLTVVVYNLTTQIFSNYSQSGRYQVGDYKNLNDTTWDSCFNLTLIAPQNMKFRVKNDTGYTTTSKTLNKNDKTFFYIIPYMFCPPGKYYGYFYVKNQTAPAENLSVKASFQLPINEQNTFNKTTNYAFFKGSLVSTHKYYHSYYFNTSIADNSTKLTLRLGPSSSNDIDVFLYDGSGNFLAKSINRSSSLEELVYDVPDTPQMYEIRVYGNISADYIGYLYFSTLNVTDSSGSKTSSISFGQLDANDVSSNQVFVLKNEDDQVLASVTEGKEIYHVDRWLNQNTDKTFKLLVPDFAQKVKIRVEWKKETGENVTDWNLYLRDSKGVLRGTSTGKYINANKTTSSNVLEEYIEFGNANTFDTTNDGFWNITVKNASIGSANLNSYNLTAYIYAPTTWIKTNYSTTTFNPSYSRAVKVNVTTPETDVLNGSYEGFLEYYQASKWKVRIPISFSVKTGTLVMNENVSITSSKKTHNTGFNTVSSPIMIKIPYNNTGGYPLYINVQNTTSNTLYQIGNNSNYINFVLSSFPTGPLSAGGKGFLNVSVKINTTKTHNRVGIYRGFVLFNTTDSTNVTRQSSLFKTFNITLYANLTNLLNITITNINPSLVTPPSSANNITLMAKVKLINGTVISNNGVMGYTNFTQIRIEETNVTTYQQTLTNIISGGAGAGCSGEICNVNGTIPANMAGGKYRVYASALWNTKMLGGTGEVLGGTGVTDILRIDDTGVYLKEVTPKDFGEVTEGTQNLYFNMTIKNYGPVSIPVGSKGKIYFHEGSACSSVLTVRYKDTNCANPASGYNSTGAYLNYTMAAYDAVGCWVRFEIDVSNISVTNMTCLMSASSANKKSFGRISDIRMDIVEAAPSDGTQTPTTPTTSTCATSDDCEDEYYCSAGTCTAVSCPSGYVSNHKCNPHLKRLSITDYESKVNVSQGGSVTTQVKVKNTGTTTINAKLDAEHNVTGITQTVTPSSYNIGAGDTYSFTVKFTVSNATKVKNHLITLKAYDKNNESVSTTKTIYLSVEPLEETKRAINQTYEDYNNLFETMKSRFLLIQPSTDVNYTKTNRTYTSLLNMFDQVKEYLENSQYADAADLLEDINASLTTFDTQIRELIPGIPGDVWTWVAIAVVIVVIVVFLVYLLLPPKKGYHPVYGYRGQPKQTISSKLGGIANKIKGIVKGIKKPGGVKKDQMTLAQFEARKTYMEGYDRTETHPYQQGISEKLKKKMKK